MKSFNQFYSEAIVLAKKGGVEGKLDKSTGKFTAGNFSDAERSRYAKYSAKPAAPAPASAPKPAAAPKPVLTQRPAPKKDERPTNRQVAAARQEAEYQRNARNLRLGKEIGADDMVKQMYRNQNSLVAQGARAQAAARNAGTWRSHQFTLDSPAPSGPKNRDYGIPDFVSDRRRENEDAMRRANLDAGMSRADAAAKARRDEAELHRKNMGYMKNRRDGYPG